MYIVASVRAPECVNCCVVSKYGYESAFVFDRSFMKSMNSSDPRMDSCSTPATTPLYVDLVPFMET